MKKLALALVALQFLAVGCAHVNSVSLTSIPDNKGKEVRAEASKTIILGFNFNNDFVDEMTEDLKNQCPNGTIRGILTKDETINYFLFFVWARKVTASGYCLQSKSVAAATEKGAR